MSDQTVLTLAGMLIGFLTLWVRLKYATDRADEARTAAKKAAAVGEKTAAVVEVVHQATNSDRQRMQAELKDLRAKVEELHTAALAREALAVPPEVMERLTRLEKYVHEGVHSVLKKMDVVPLKTAQVAAALAGQKPPLEVPGEEEFPLAVEKPPGPKPEGAGEP